MSSIFGNIFDPTILEKAAAQTLHDWMPTYLREIEDQRGFTVGNIPAPRSYVRRNRFDTLPADQMPMCVVVSPGLYEGPTKEGDGKYGAWYSLGVGVATNARDADAADMLAKIYGAAVKAIFVQKSSFGNVCSGLMWLDESYDDVPMTVNDEPVSAARLVFAAFIDDIVTKGAGPAFPTPPDPVDLPGSTWPTADVIDVDTVLVPIDEEV